MKILVKVTRLRVSVDRAIHNGSKISFGILFHFFVLFFEYLEDCQKHQNLWNLKNL